MEVMLRVAFEYNKLVIFLKVVLTDDAFHTRYNLIVVAVDHLKKACNVPFQSDFL